MRSLQKEAADAYFEDLYTKTNALYEVISLSKEVDLMMWNWFETNLSDRGIYFGDATPEDLVEILRHKEIFVLYGELEDSFPNIFLKKERDE